MAFFLATQTIHPIFSIYIMQRGASILEVGLIVSILSFVAILSKIPLGILAERAGKWPIIPISLLGQSLSLLLYSLVSSAYWFYPVRIFHAIMLSAFFPTALAIVSDLAPVGKRGDVIGKFLTSFGVASMFGPFLCSLLVNYLDYVQLLRLVAIIPFSGFAALLLASYRNSHTFYFRGRRSHKEGRFGLLSSLKSITSSRNVLVLSYLRLTFSFTTAFLITIFPLYASKSLHISPSLIAVLFGLKGVTNMVFRIPSGKLSDKIGRKIPLILSYLLLTLVFFVISETGDFYILSIAMTVYGLIHGMRAVTEWALLGDSAQAEIGGVATAYLSTMFDIGDALGAVASGALSLILPVQSIFKLASLIVLPGAFLPLLIKQNE